MRRSTSLWVIACVLLGWSAEFAAGAKTKTSAKTSAQTKTKTCPEILHQFDIKDVFHDQAALRDALQRVLNARVKASKRIPKLDERISTSSELGDSHFMSMASKLTIDVELGNPIALNLTATSQRTEDVFALQSGGETFYLAEK